MKMNLRMEDAQIVRCYRKNISEFILLLILIVLIRIDTILCRMFNLHVKIHNGMAEYINKEDEK